MPGCAYSDNQMIGMLDHTWTDPDAADRFDRAIEGLLWALLAFMPLAFGAVQAWSEEIVVLLVAAILVVFCFKHVCTCGASLHWTWAYVPIAAFILVAVLQVSPLPVSLLRLISPQTVSQKLDLLSALDAPGSASSRMAVSFYTHATWQGVRMVLAVVAVFLVVLHTVSKREQLERLLLVIAVVGGVVAVESLVQASAGNGKIYWVVATPNNIALSGPFVNHSHLAQFMNLSIGAALGVILMRMHRRFHGKAVTPAAGMEYLGSREARIVLYLMIVVVLGAASVFVSLSRGGIISMIIAGIATVLIVGVRRSMRHSGWLLVVLALGAFTCVLYMGFDAVYERLGTLRNMGEAHGGRWQIVKDVAVAWTRFPFVGTGLGTHEVVYPMFDRATIPAVASHAENEYAQAAEETGLWGLCALIAFGVIVWISYVRAIRHTHDPARSAAYGLGFGLMAILLHSLSDFGQHLPANAFLSAIFCALLIRLSGRGFPELDATVPAGNADRSNAGPRRSGILALAVVGGVCLIALHDADAARRAEAHWAKALEMERHLAENQWQGTDEEYTYLIRHSLQAHECQPADITYRHWLNVYRWRAISRAKDPNTGSVVVSPQLLEFADRIAHDVKEGLRHCPTFGPSWTILGQIERYVLSQEDVGARHILLGRRLAPNDPTTCLVAGTLSAEQRQTDTALGHLRRAVDLDATMFPEVVALCVHTLDRPDLALELAADDISRLTNLRQTLRDAQSHPELVAALSDRVLQLLERECADPDVPAGSLASLAQIYSRDGRSVEAIDLYRRALDLQYGQVTWRYQLAQLLTGLGLNAEAVRELEICLSLQPEFRAARQLLERLSTQSSLRTDLLNP